MRFKAPQFHPYPPELEQPPKEIKSWGRTLNRYLGFLIRSLKDDLGKALLDLDQHITRLDTLEARTKDGYTFTVIGTVTPGVKATVPLPVIAAGTIKKAYAKVQTAPTGAAIIVDVNKNGTSIWDATQANRLQVAAAATSGSQTVFDATTVAEDDELSIDIDQIGSGQPGADLVVQLRIA